MKLNLIARLLWATLLQHIDALKDAKAESDCLCLPGDACWPSQNTWAALNSTVNGKLVATVPIGSPCHDPTYDAAKCDQLKSSWLNPLTQ